MSVFESRLRKPNVNQLFRIIVYDHNNLSVKEARMKGVYVALLGSHGIPHSAFYRRPTSPIPLPPQQFPAPDTFLSAVALGKALQSGQ